MPQALESRSRSVATMDAMSNERRNHFRQPSFPDPLVFINSNNRMLYGYRPGGRVVLIVYKLCLSNDLRLISDRCLSDRQLCPSHHRLPRRQSSTNPQSRPVVAVEWPESCSRPTTECTATVCRERPVGRSGSGSAPHQQRGRRSDGFEGPQSREVTTTKYTKQEQLEYCPWPGLLSCISWLKIFPDSDQSQRTVFTGSLKFCPTLRET